MTNRTQGMAPRTRHSEQPPVATDFEPLKVGDLVKLVDTKRPNKLADMIGETGIVEQRHDGNTHVRLHDGGIVAWGAGGIWERIVLRGVDTCVRCGAVLGNDLWCTSCGADA